MNKKLRKELLDMQKADENIRIYIDNEVKKLKEPSQKLWEEVAEVDFENTSKLFDIVEKYGWPTISLVGEDGSKAAWLIIQHAGHKPEFQEYCLELIERNMLIGEVDKRNYVYLKDRILMHQGLPQIYGTQFQMFENGDLNLYDTFDIGNLDIRRKLYGLGPIEDYKKKLENFEKTF